MRAVLLLRAVNVGGTKVPMADLRLLLEGLGLRNVRTYLQSGNAVFDAEASAESAAATTQELAAAIETRIGRVIAQRVGALVLEAGVLASVAAANPFGGAAGSPAAGVEGIDPAWLHVTFLLFGGTGEADFGLATDEAFSAAYAAAYDKLALPAVEGERAVFAGLPALPTPVVYLCLPHGYGRTKLNNGYFERRLGAAATTRNWRTVQALVEMSDSPTVPLEPWGDGDLPLLTRLLGDPAMTEHLGGPESPEKLAERQARYVKLGAPGKGRMCKIVDATSGEGIGSVGYWETEWKGETVYEAGWSVLAEYQGRGLAREATAQVIALAAAERTRRFLHAFPSVDNEQSNAICRKLGFTLLGPVDVEYPRGRQMRSNDWRLDLRGRE
jgi:uncharacterized protein (DUF1697 family)/L-amino acid N-acyltransferase YncA